MLDRIEFLLSEAFVSLRRNPLMSFAAMTTVAVALFLIGGLGYAYYGITKFAGSIPGKFEIRVFLREDADAKAVTKAASDIRAIPGVATASWIPKDKAWAKYKAENPEIAEGLENPYPHAFKVTLKDLSQGDAIAEQIRKLPEVEPGSDGVRYLKDEQQMIDQALRVLRWLGTAVGGLLFLTGGILIYNAIRLAAIARRLEIRVMQLVGASRAMIRIPFLIEGLVHGFLGGLLATLMLMAAHRVFSNFLVSLDARTQLANFPAEWAALILGGIGAGYGLFCSAVAVRMRGQIG